MGDVVATAGGSSVRISGIEEEILAVLEQVAPAVRQAFEREAQLLIDNARPLWPVRTGRSKAGLHFVTRVTEDYLETVTYNAESYGYKIRYSKWTRAEIDKMISSAKKESRKRRIKYQHGEGAPNVELAGEAVWATLVQRPARVAEKRLVEELTTEMEKL